MVEITEMLQQHHPTVKAMSFVGHSTKSQSGKGFSQKKQLEVLCDLLCIALVVSMLPSSVERRSVVGV